MGEQVRSPKVPKTSAKEDIDMVNVSQKLLRMTADRERFNPKYIRKRMAQRNMRTIVGVLTDLYLYIPFKYLNKSQ